MKNTSQFKQTNIGKIPKDWNIIRFSKILIGKTRNGIYKSKVFRGKGTKMINMGELFKYNRINDSDMELIELSDSEKERFLVKNGDLLFARRSLVAEGAGKCSLVTENIERTFESSLIRARPNSKKASSEFLFYFFNSKIGKHLLDSILRQVAVAGITGTDLMNLEIPLPSVKEQSDIAKILSEMDFKIELNHRMNRNLEAIGEAVFRRWFVDFEFPNEEGKPYKLSGGKMVYNDELEKEIPKGWSNGKIHAICDVIYGYPFSSKLFNTNKLGKPLIRIRDLKTLNPDFYTTEKDSRATLVKPSDVVAGMDGEFTPYIWQGVLSFLNQRLCPFKPNKPTIHEFFVYQTVKPLLKKEEKTKVGTTVIHLAKRDIEQWQIIVPCEVVLEKFHQIISPIVERLVLNSREMRILGQIRDSLLPKLMSGKIRVPVSDEVEV